MTFTLTRVKLTTLGQGSEIFTCLHEESTGTQNQGDKLKCNQESRTLFPFLCLT